MADDAAPRQLVNEWLYPPDAEPGDHAPHVDPSYAASGTVELESETTEQGVRIRAYWTPR